MQVVSPTFTAAVNSSVKKPQPGCLISWKKDIDESVKFFTLDHSYLDGPDKLKGAGGTITFADKYDYVNETAYVKNFRVIKKISNRPWGVIMATAEIELNNTSKRFMPDFDPVIGAYVSLPERPVKLSIGYNGEFIKLFTGYSERPESKLVKRVTTITAYDAMTYLSTVKSSLPAFVNTSAHDIIETLLIEQGFSASQFNIEPSLQQPISYLMPNERIVTEIFEEICEAEGYLLHADEDGLIQGWNRLHFLGDRTAVRTFNYSNMADINWSSSSIINSARVVAKPYKVMGKTLIWSSGQTLKLAPGATTDIFADFKDDLGSFPCISIDTPLPPSTATTSQYAVNFNEEGTASDASSSVSLSSTYLFGERYRMSFTNTSDQPVFITRLQLYGIPAKIQFIDAKTQEIPISIEKHGLNPDNGRKVYEIDNDLIQDTATANAMAWMMVNIYGNPHSRMDIDNFVVPHIQIGDPVNVYVADTLQTKYCNVLGLEIFFGVNANLKQTLYVEEREVHTYFRLDHSHLDGSDGLAL
jgi:hypothetical protein